MRLMPLLKTLVGKSTAEPGGGSLGGGEASRALALKHQRKIRVALGPGTYSHLDMNFFQNFIQYNIS